MILYRSIPKKGVNPEDYTGLIQFAFEAFGYIFFTDRITAEVFGIDVVEIYPVSK